MTKPKITVIIPTRERAGVLEAALRTATAQNYEGLEIIVSDNCSGDGTDAVVQRAVDGGQRNANCKSKLPDALVLAGNFVPYDVGKFVHNSTLFTVDSRSSFASG